MNKQNPIHNISTSGENLGIESIELLLEKYNIRLEIWLDNRINGDKRIALVKIKEKNRPLFNSIPKII